MPWTDYSFFMNVVHRNLTTRRDYEWKILFGVIGLLAALDAAQLAYGVQLYGWIRYAWVGVVSTLAISCFWFEWGLQYSNYHDRRAMNAIYNRLCRAINLATDSHILERDHSRRAGLWAFVPQMLFLLLVAGVSAALPWLELKPTRH
jgi:hypothetical protein